MCFGFAESFIHGPHLFMSVSARDPVTFSITQQLHAQLLRNKIMPDLQAHHCYLRIILMQNGTITHNSYCVLRPKKTFQGRTCQQLPIFCSQSFSSPDFNPCDLWHSRNLKHLISHGIQELYLILKIEFYNMFLTFPTSLQTAMEHVMLRFDLVAVIECHRTEHVLFQ